MRDPLALTHLQNRLELEFQNIAILEQAMRHRSCCQENPSQSNERLEFLGDSIVGALICEQLFELHPYWTEGQLAKAKAYIVSEPTLAQAGIDYGVHLAVELNDAEESAGGRQRKSIVSDAFEALMAAVYLDQGIDQTRRIVRQSLETAITNASGDRWMRDFKSALQERIQAEFRVTPIYNILEESGADHDKTFKAQAVLGDRVIGEGIGKTKKEAEQMSAQSALEILNKEKLVAGD